jgi:hypothetical protein
MNLIKEKKNEPKERNKKDDKRRRKMNLRKEIRKTIKEQTLLLPDKTQVMTALAKTAVAAMLSDNNWVAFRKHSGGSIGPALAGSTLSIVLQAEVRQQIEDVLYRLMQEGVSSRRH